MGAVEELTRGTHPGIWVGVAARRKCRLNRDLPVNKKRQVKVGGLVGRLVQTTKKKVNRRTLGPQWIFCVLRNLRFIFSGMMGWWACFRKSSFLLEIHTEIFTGHVLSCLGFLFNGSGIGWELHETRVAITWLRLKSGDGCTQGLCNYSFNLCRLKLCFIKKLNC